MTDRRRFLLGLGAAGAFGAQAATATALEPRILRFHALHTGERLEAPYWRDGQLQSDALDAINRLLRDHRTGDVHPIDLRLLDLLHALSSRLETRASFQVISGYRSPATNSALADASSGVARRSLHMDGKAIDISLPDRELSTVRSAALALGVGGVGYYPGSGFVHVDVGRVRQW